MLNSVLVGALLTIATVGIHAVGTTWWIRRLRGYRESALNDSRSWLQFRVLSTTALLLLSLHIVEVVLWAMTYMILPDLGELASLEEAIYFSTVTYSSLGYGDLVIEGPWRLLSAIQAMAGVLIFGWSTALFIAVVQHLWNPSAKASAHRD